MKLLRTCKDVTRLVLESQDRPLGLADRVSLRLHWLACSNCARFRQQSDTMRQAVKRWRSYREE
jgi:hypothetical protein